MKWYLSFPTKQDIRTCKTVRSLHGADLYECQNERRKQLKDHNRGCLLYTYSNFVKVIIYIKAKGDVGCEGYRVIPKKSLLSKKYRKKKKECML